MSDTKPENMTKTFLVTPTKAKWLKLSRAQCQQCWYEQGKDQSSLQKMTEEKKKGVDVLLSGEVANILENDAD